MLITYKLDYLRHFRGESNRYVRRDIPCLDSDLLTDIGEHEEQDDEQHHSAGDDLGRHEEGEPGERHHQLGRDVELGQGGQHLQPTRGELAVT